MLVECQHQQYMWYGLDRSSQLRWGGGVYIGEVLVFPYPLKTSSSSDWCSWCFYHDMSIFSMSDLFYELKDIIQPKKRGVERSTI
jgi:hypothetical protein